MDCGIEVRLEGFHVSQLVSHIRDIRAEIHHCLIIAILRSELSVVLAGDSQVQVCQHVVAGILGCTTQLASGIFLLLRQEFGSILQIANNLCIDLFLAVARDSGTGSGLVGLGTQRHTTIQANKYIVVMRTQEECFTQTLLLDRLRQTGSHVHRLDQGVTLTYADPRRTPHIERHTIVGHSGEISGLYRLQTIGTTTGTYIRVSGHDIQRPKALVVHIAGLQRTIAGIRHGLCHSIGYLNGCINRIVRSAFQEITARQYQSCGCYGCN